MADVPGLARLVAGSTAPRRRPASGRTSFDLHLVGMQQIRDRLFPGRDVFVADRLFLRPVVPVVLEVGLVRGPPDGGDLLGLFLLVVIERHFGALDRSGDRFIGPVLPAPLRASRLFAANFLPRAFRGCFGRIVVLPVGSRNRSFAWRRSALSRFAAPSAPPSAPALTMAFIGPAIFAMSPRSLAAALEMPSRAPGFWGRTRGLCRLAPVAARRRFGGAFCWRTCSRLGPHHPQAEIIRGGWSGSSGRTAGRGGRAG